MTTTNLTNSKAAQKAGLKIKRNLVLVFIIICLTGGSALYAQDTKSREQERTEKKANSDQRKVDRDKHKLDKKQVKTDKKARKVERTEQKADKKD